MIVIDADNKKIEIRNNHWPLAEELFVKWNMLPDSDNVIRVKNVDDISPELSAWGIPWRWS